MSGKRKTARKKRQRRAIQQTQVLDVHAAHLMDSMEGLGSLIDSLNGSSDPVADVQDQFNEALSVFVKRLERFEALRLVEVARMAILPWMREGQYLPVADASAAHVELLALMALAVEECREGPPTGEPAEVQEMSSFISEARDNVDVLLNLSHMRATLMADRSDKLAFISMMVRGSQVMVRNTSYADMVEPTVLETLDGQADVRAALRAGIGFDAHDAVKVLGAVHHVQQDQVNSRAERFADALNDLRDTARLESSGDEDTFGEPSEELRERLTAAWLAAMGEFFEPDADASTVAVADLVNETGLAEEVVRAVVRRFMVDISGQSPSEVVDGFMAGNNPLRPRPLIAVRGADRVLLPHNSLSMDAVKENLEEYLKGADAWETYQQHRGAYVESRVRAALERVVPNAVIRDSLVYYAPANAAEEASADPDRYTKRAECDHLVVVDDVAFIVEDKAVALSPGARGGRTQRLRTDLTKIITKAAEQAGRLKNLIERDGGVRTDHEGWVDLSQIREIHTIAVSLDDLLSVATATVELTKAGLLEPDNIPWTVSLHDLDLITHLVDRPSEFLLYLRRRRDPHTTQVFMAPDELDLFLLFFDGELWAEPDPDAMRKAFPFMGPPTAGDRRKFREQGQFYVTSRTDALDEWYYTRDKPGGPSAPKPRMFDSPVGPLVDELNIRGTFGALSLGATLLSGSTAFQKQMATQAEILLDNPHPGRSRQVAVPITQMVNAADGWLLVWATHPTGTVDLAATVVDQQRYLLLKKHQLGLHRGALFVFDQSSRQLVHISYDGHVGDIAEDLKPMLARLKPPDHWQKRPPPKVMRPRRGNKRNR